MLDYNIFCLCWDFCWSRALQHGWSTFGLHLITEQALWGIAYLRRLQWLALQLSVVCRRAQAWVRAAGQVRIHRVHCCLWTSPNTILLHALSAPLSVSHLRNILLSDCSSGYFKILLYALPLYLICNDWPGHPQVDTLQTVRWMERKAVIKIWFVRVELSQVQSRYEGGIIMLPLLVLYLLRLLQSCQSRMVSRQRPTCMHPVVLLQQPSLAPK